MIKPSVKIYTDGACANNPGKGGYGIVLLYQKQDGKVVQKNLSRGFELTTNNRMELLAVIKGLEALKENCAVDLYSDSQYVVDAFNKNWINQWVENNWKSASKKPVKNIDLWQKLLLLLERHTVNFIKVEGHADNIYNNKCDKIAVNEYKKAQNKNLENQ